MFGIGGWEFVLIAVLALLLFGPDKLPQIARTLGRFMRDFKRYQAMMESTIRGEIFAADPDLQKDQFETGKAFREKVAGGGFSKPVSTPAPEPALSDEPAASEGEASDHASEPAQSAGEAEEVSAITGEIALDDDVLAADDAEGEGERGDA